jgi:transglutaminase-like putative cysteine protease
MHYGKPVSIDDKYFTDPWLNPDAKYGIKQVGRDFIVDLYQKSKEDGGNYTFGHGNAIYACDIGVGNCTDYHSYFMSLDRTLGIPARFHMGFLIPSRKEGEINGYHCWADYYVEDEGWYPVDISEADKDPNRKDYYFGTVDNNRLEMMVGRDFILKGYESKVVNIFIYPIMEINDKKSLDFSKSFSYKNLSD